MFLIYAMIDPRNCLMSSLLYMDILKLGISRGEKMTGQVGWTSQNGFGLKLVIFGMVGTGFVGLDRILFLSIFTIFLLNN